MTYWQEKLIIPSHCTVFTLSLYGFLYYWGSVPLWETLFDLLEKAGDGELSKREMIW